MKNQTAGVRNAAFRDRRTAGVSVKRWKTYMTAVIFLVAAAVLCSCAPKREAGTEESSQAAVQEQAGEAGSAGAEKTSSGEKSWKRTILKNPENARRVTSSTYQSDGTLRICVSNEESRDYSVWDSRDNGDSWEKADADVSLSLEDGDGYKYSAEGGLYVCNSKTLIFSAGDGTQGKTIQAEERETIFSAAVSANTLAVSVRDDANCRFRLDLYDLRTMERRQADNPELSEYLALLSQRAGGYAALNSTGTVVYLDGAGIARYDLLKDEFRYLVDEETYDKLMHPNRDNGLFDSVGIQNSFAVNDREDQVFVATWSTDTHQPKLYRFEWGDWREEKQAERGKLRIYSLSQNDRAVGPISHFQEKYPELEIIYETGYTGEDGVTIPDAVRILNTELMAGEGPDVLFLDGLPGDSYVEKGILEDLTDFVEPEKKKYFYNVISAYNGGGKIYQIPMEFRAPVILGDADVTAAKNREELMKVFKEKAAAGIPVMPPKGLPEAAAELFVTSDILGDTLDQAKLAEYYRDLQIIAELSFLEGEREQMNEYDKMTYWAEWYPNLGYDVELDLYFDKAQAGIKQFWDLEPYMYYLTVSKEKGTRYQYLNRENGNHFVGVNVIGINRSGKNPDMAKEFLRYYLSEVDQEITYRPIVRDQWKGSKYISEQGEYSHGISGKYTPEEIMPLYKVTPADLEELTAFFDGLDTPVKADAVVLQKVMEQADACVFEGKDPKSAAKDACREVNLYLNE